MPGHYHYEEGKGGGPTTADMVEERSYLKPEQPSIRVHIGQKWNGIKWVPAVWESNEPKRPRGYR